MRCFGTKFRSIRRIYERSEVAIDAKVRSFRAKATQSTTVITSIVFRVIRKISSESNFRHCENRKIRAKQSINIKDFLDIVLNLVDYRRI